MPSKIAKTEKTSIKRRKSTHGHNPPKKRKLQSSGSQSNAKGKQRAYERDTIPLPNEPQDDQDSLISEEDMDFFRENIPDFLTNLDTMAISRSKKEISRLHDISKPKNPVKRELSFSGDDDSDFSSLSESEQSDASTASQSEDDLEQAYESRSRQAAISEQRETVPRLPIKMSDGRIVKTGHRLVPDENKSEDVSESSDTENSSPENPKTDELIASASVLTVTNVPRQLQIQTAKEEIAQICQSILADPENSLSLLRRLHVFTLPRVLSAEPTENDPLIRQLAMISELAVLKDIIPGYRIRPLTDAEKNEKVSQAILRTREWEQGLVSVYQTYLRSLQTELKNKTPFADLALKSMCTLLKEATHFNFRSNIINAIVSTLSKKQWNNRSEMCSQTLISVFKTDKGGNTTLEIVQMLSRMIKERHFMVHPNIFSCLLHLRLGSHLPTVRASETKIERENDRRMDKKRGKGKKIDQPYLSKKAKKVLKERKEIEKQLQVADAEVDQEERTKMQSETLKLLFGLYFRILKLPGWSPLLIPALEGISRHAHMVNIDFFKDLMDVLKSLVSRPSEISEDLPKEPSKVTMLRYKLSCIVTAFELLTGQGDALNVDLKDFYFHLYNLIIPASLEAPREITHSTTDILFRGLSLAFPAHRGNVRAPIRTAAFAKRLLSAFFLFPATVVTKVLNFIEQLISNEPKLLALLSTEDRSINGLYRPDIDEPELCNPFATSLWELTYLAGAHQEQKIRHKAQIILNLSV